MFFDEIDALGRRRGTDYGSGARQHSGDVSGPLGRCAEDAGQRRRDRRTNRADSLDPGLTRPGRLDLKLTVPRPNRRAAECILRRYLGGRPLAGRSVWTDGAAAGRSTARSASTPSWRR